MSEPVSVVVDGGTQAERNLVSNHIESSLVSAGFKVDNNVTPLETDSETLLDYAKKANPDLFNQSIEISEVFIEDEDEDSVLIEEEEEEVLESEED